MRKNPPPTIQPGDVNDICNEIKSEMEKTPPGGTYTHPKLRWIFRKHNIESELVSFKETNRAGHRLVAKIAFESAMLLLGDRCHLLKDHLDPLRRFVQFNEPLDPSVIRAPRGLDAFDRSKADYCHWIRIGVSEKWISLEICLFGVADFQISMLPLPDEVCGPVIIGDKKCQGAGFWMRFDPGKRKEKGIVYQLKGRQKWRLAECPRL